MCSARARTGRWRRGSCGPRAAEVEDQRAPVRVLAALGIGVLVERRAVEPAQRELVGGEVGRHPVDDHADPAVVERVDHGREVVRVAEAGGRRVVAGDLVAPRAVERVLGHRQQLDVGEAEPVAVLDELRRGLAVSQPGAVGVAHPGPEVDLVGRHRGPIRIALAIAGASSRHRSRDRSMDPRRATPSPAHLHREGERVGLQAQHPVTAEDLVLVELAGADAGDERSHTPDAPIERSGSSRPSQRSKSPTIRTLRAFGAHTAKLTPRRPGACADARPGRRTAARAFPRR